MDFEYIHFVQSLVWSDNQRDETKRRERSKMTRSGEGVESDIGPLKYNVLRVKLT